MPNRQNRKKSNQKDTVRYFDYSLLFILIFLVGFGLVMLYSASAYEGVSEFDDATHYLKRQAMCAAGGFVVMMVISFLPLGWIRKLTPLVYIGAILLGFAVIAVGSSSNGSTRWLKIGGVKLQPSEFAKIAVILFLALLLSRIPRQMNRVWSIVKVLVLVAFLVVPIAVSNLSTAIIVAGIAVVMIFVVSSKYRIFVGFAVAAGVLAFAGAQMLGYRAERIAAWLHPEEHTDKAYQTLQGMYAIGSGGLFGKGLGAGVQKFGAVPEAQNDFIFTIICEELGLFGGICVIVLFVLLLWRCMVIANNAPDLYSALLVVGVMAHIAIQVVLNIMVVTNWMPNTGIILPFISYGGTSILVTIAEMGLVFNVSRQIRFDAEPERSVKNLPGGQTAR